MKKRICLVSSSHLGSNPRLVKEADALHAAGYEVRVVSADVSESVRTRDADVLRRAGWRHVPVGRGTRLGHATRVACQRVAAIAQSILPRSTVALSAWRESWLWHRLADVAASEPADLFIGHNLPALPAVVAASDRVGSACAFDVEDDHCLELPPNERNSARYRGRDGMLAKLLPRCRYVTAASPGIAAAIAARYDVPTNLVQNVFPLSEREGLAPAPRTLGSPLRFYWYSQTVGLDRGLSELIHLLGLSRTRVTLTIRGDAEPHVAAKLSREAMDAQVTLRLEPLAAPGEMTRLAAEHDIGVCFELADGNRGIAAANKLYTYVLAGMPMLLSAMPAHIAFAEQLGTSANGMAGANAALLVDPNDENAPRRLSEWLAQSDELAAASRRLWEIGTERLNWDVEKDKFLGIVSSALGSG